MLQKFAAIVAAAGLVVTVACAQTDAGISTNVKAKMAADDTVKAYQIDVDTANGVVTLTGAVDSAAAKEHAVLIARNTDGVRDVVDQLRVDATEATSGVDIDIDDDLNRAGNAVEREAREAADKTEDLADRAGGVVVDAALTTAVKTKFLADDMVKGLDIDVDTDDGVVTLNGRVASRAMADRATTIARNTNGVKSVVSNLRVGS